MSISSASMICIVIALIMGILIPLGLFIVLRKKTKASMKSFWIGCLIMFAFALTVESLVHQAVYATEVGKIIWGSTILYAVYGGLMAGLFEETGRFVAFKFFLKKEQENDENALAYAGGHASMEVFAILFFTMLNNLTYAMVMRHPEKMAQVNQFATPEQAEQIAEVYKTLHETPAWTYLLSVVERGSAVVLQFALTILVWFAVKKGGKKFILFPLAILLHALVDGSAVVVHQLTGNVFLTEGCILVFSILCFVFACRVWKQERVVKETIETSK
ncbi:MAG: YhfC family intramembrane metalloprotease [Lachnospiraceae bacterium]|nr:YhfC family intramembrane metalloprotease [Lachnospiraceae bacterium]